jgi:hypothetical protein
MKILCLALALAALVVALIVPVTRLRPGAPLTPSQAAYLASQQQVQAQRHARYRRRLAAGQCYPDGSPVAGR